MSVIACIVLELLQEHATVEAVMRRLHHSVLAKEARLAVVVHHVDGLEGLSTLVWGSTTHQLIVAARVKIV